MNEPALDADVYLTEETIKAIKAMMPRLTEEQRCRVVDVIRQAWTPDGEACLFCGKERKLKPQCSKQRWEVCSDHFMVTCPECGHEAFWMEKSNGSGRYVCFSLECDWWAASPPQKKKGEHHE